ncbi:SPFH domain-containing protein [Chenggangzhangella methanolivorans]|uniref:SPFH domain-containing protein n=1 Tax=Chenggangzhangella methanolivorans TaxID=1437009 RepID=A0A9E6R888_9HYPH|nr:SPFH domain-containing protein [Chenggangzhangella methanolivorans]QZN99863.1 SPFH domain-containing protein [Chenggangzhangella methanolivorans]
MFGIKYFKAAPNTHVLAYKNGRVAKEGAGLSFFYATAWTSIVAVPLDSVDAPFMFAEVSKDFQEVTVQGQATVRVVDPKQLASLMNFALDAKGRYASDAPFKLPQRVVNAVQVRLRAVLQTMTLRELLRSSDVVVERVAAALREPDALPSLGLDLVSLAVLAIKPNPETARALEAQVREELLKEADDATYARRNSAIEQERAVRENELATERVVLEKRQQIDDQAMGGSIALEERNKALTSLRAENARTEAQAKAFAMAELMKSVAGVDPRVLQALTVGQADPNALIAAAFQGLAENAERIGELNISPDLLQELARRTPEKAKPTR